MLRWKVGAGAAGTACDMSIIPLAGKRFLRSGFSFYRLGLLYFLVDGLYSVDDPCGQFPEEHFLLSGSAPETGQDVSPGGHETRFECERFVFGQSENELAVTFLQVCLQHIVKVDDFVSADQVARPDQDDFPFPFTLDEIGPTTEEQ